MISDTDSTALFLAMRSRLGSLVGGLQTYVKVLEHSKGGSRSVQVDIEQGNVYRYTTFPCSRTHSKYFAQPQSLFNTSDR